MSAYGFVRRLYRWSDRAVLARLPAGAQAQLRNVLFRLARRAFPARIQARSPVEFATGAPSRKEAPVHLPEWAQAEVRELVALEPALAPLVGDDARLESYVVPWDLTYVGRRYAEARRALRGGYRSLVFVRGMDGDLAAALRGVPGPMAIIDVADCAGEGALPATVDCVRLPAQQLDANDHCAMLARLVLQLAPNELYYAPDALLERCIERHGRAMASVACLHALAVGGAGGPPDAGAEGKAP